MTYQSPASKFLSDHEVSSLEDVIEYTNFLLTSAGIDVKRPPIDLHRIYSHFNFPLPKETNFPNQQGATIFTGGAPQILIHEDDKTTRQRFTEAHELIETLFKELPGEIRLDRVKENIFGTKKERICQVGAANLLMPKDSFYPKTQEMGISFRTGERLASLYQVSLMASLFRLVDLYPNQVAVILWQLKNKKSELEKKVPDNQMSFFDERPPDLPPPNLRVKWAYGKYKNCYIPPDKSIPEDSSVYKSWETNKATRRTERIDFGSSERTALLENKPVAIEEERSVLSLVSEPT